MGNSLGVPLAYAVSRTVANENGVRTGLKEVVAHSYLERNYKRNRRLDFYAWESADISNFDNINFTIPKAEIALEHPRKIQNNNDVDSIFFCGFNSKQESLVVKISVNKQQMAAAWVSLQLADGRKFSLPTEKLYRVPVRRGPETFTAGGLRLRCLQAMRKWRISFSGLLEEMSSNSEDSKLVYVKFSFIWTASSFLYDLNSDLPTKAVAKFMSKENWSGYVPDLKCVSGKLDTYVQGGILLGTYQLEEEDEQKIHLWGSRKRSYDHVPPGKDYDETEFFAYLEEGEMIHFGSLGIPTSPSNRLHHGCIVQGNSLGGAVDEVAISKTNTGDVIEFRRGEFSWTATFQAPPDCVSGNNADGSSTKLLISRVQLDDQFGYGVKIITTWSRQNQPQVIPKYYLKDVDEVSVQPLPFALSLKQSACRDSSLTGGKGSSLADLLALSAMDGTFSVPKGVVVTSASYEEFLKVSRLGTEISALETIAWKNIPVDLQKECQRVSKIVGEAALPEPIRQAIVKALTKEFGNDLNQTRLAVRSSASGEDSEEMSAAGQMKTFLGVKGLDMVYTSVIKCWASQFEYTAIQYKRQNGQILNSPMAVVIQEMVPADVAGVMFTCDPVSGNPARITITANYGIGESVVSASADPDTIIVDKKATGETEISNIQLGAKKNMIVMTDTGVTEEDISEDFSSQCSLGSKLAKNLADLGVQIEETYGCLMDVEWAVRNNNIYLLQARPVTTFDKETDYEIIHEMDSPLRSEDEWLSTANVGEVFAGAMSFLGNTTLQKGFEVVLRKLGKRMKDTFPYSPYYQLGMLSHANHAVFNVLESQLRHYYGKHTIVTTTQNLAFCGRVLDDPEMLLKATRRNRYNPSVSASAQTVHILRDMYTAESRLKQRRMKFPVGTVLEIPLSQTSEELYWIILNQWISLNEQLTSHFQCSMYSSFSSLFLITALSDGTGALSTEAFSDLAYILSNCSGLESVEVPNAIEHVAKEIINSEEGTRFHEMDTRDALMWLERTESPAGEGFRTLIKNHGHRGLQEFDLFTKPWGANPIPLVKTIQELVSKKSIQQRNRAPATAVETIKNLKVPLNWKSRLTLRFIIPFCRKAVALREGSKSLMISVVDCMRHSYRRLAEQMVAEGRLPDPELIYFFTHFELLQLLQTRSPKMVQKAARRKAMYPSLNAMIYPETCRGFPEPVNFAKKEAVREGSFTMKGVPASQGTATGYARVATSLEEASQLQAGEILIAYSTDIGWSPYFPMLGGVATELGGLVSHGAVVAREYGLPCVVGVHGATLKFNTGDKVLVDGTKGILSRLDD